MKNLIVISIVLLLFSCRAKKEYIHTTSIDTIRIEKIIKITPAQLNSIKIDSPCDSLGNLKPFSYTFTSDKVKTTLKATNDTIYLEQNIDSLLDIREKEVRKSIKTKDKLIIKYKTPRWIWYSVLLNILLLLYISKRFIPFLKLLPF